MNVSSKGPSSGKKRVWTRFFQTKGLCSKRWYSLRSVTTVIKLLTFYLIEIIACLPELLWYQLGKGFPLSKNLKYRQAFGPFVTRLFFNSSIHLQIFRFIRKLHFQDFGFGISTFGRYFPDVIAHKANSCASFSKDQVPLDLCGQRMTAIFWSTHLASSVTCLSRMSINQSRNLGLCKRCGLDNDIVVRLLDQEMFVNWFPAMMEWTYIVQYNVLCFINDSVWSHGMPWPRRGFTNKALRLLDAWCFKRSLQFAQWLKLIQPVLIQASKCDDISRTKMNSIRLNWMPKLCDVWITLRHFQ